MDVYISVIGFFFVFVIFRVKKLVECLLIFKCIWILGCLVISIVIGVECDSGLIIIFLIFVFINLFMNDVIYVVNDLMCFMYNFF